MHEHAALLPQCGTATGQPRQGVLSVLLCTLHGDLRQFCVPLFFWSQLLLPRPSAAPATFKHYHKPACIMLFDLQRVIGFGPTSTSEHKGLHTLKSHGLFSLFGSGHIFPVVGLCSSRGSTTSLCTISTLPVVPHHAQKLPPTPLVACTRSVLLDAEGNAFLSDFGLSRPMQDASKLYTGTLAGTYFFM